MGSGLFALMCRQVGVGVVYTVTMPDGSLLPRPPVECRASFFATFMPQPTRVEVYSKPGSFARIDEIRSSLSARGNCRASFFVANR
jgi:hypothetical protein